MADVDFLDINPLVYKFKKLREASTGPTASLTKDALQILTLMSKHRALNPGYPLIVEYLRSTVIPFTFDPEKITSDRDDFMYAINETVTERLGDMTPVEDSKQLFNDVLKAIVIYIIEGNYEEASFLIDRLGSIVQFSSQPSFHNELVQNRYLEFLFYQYIVNVYRSIWFPVDEPTALKNNRGWTHIKEKDPDSSNKAAFKSVEAVYKKIQFYYTKNDILLNISTSELKAQELATELRYYWLARFVNLSLLFKQCKFQEFYQEFLEIFVAKGSDPGIALSFFGEHNTLQTPLLIMFGTTMIFSRPFKDLSLLDVDDNDTIINLFDLDESRSEYAFYHDILFPLSVSNFKLVHGVLSQASFINKFNANLGYLLPNAVSGSKGSFIGSFTEYIILMINLKNFLLIISVTKQVSSAKLIELLGYREDETDYIKNKLLLLISVLSLGKLGVGYDSDQDLFFNHQTSGESAELQENIDRLTDDLKSESIATLMKGVLIERYFTT